jgi:hypothetical protein
MKGLLREGLDALPPEVEEGNVEYKVLSINRTLDVFLASLGQTSPPAL